MENAKKTPVVAISAIILVLIAAGIAGYFYFGKEKAPALTENGSVSAPLPKEIVLASPDEARDAASNAIGMSQSGSALSAAEYEQVRKNMAWSGASGSGAPVANAESIAAKVAQLKKNGKEYLEDYLKSSYDSKQAFDSQKMLTLPLGDAAAFERFLGSLSQFDPAALEKIGPVLLKRTSFGLEFDENSLEGYLSKNYASGKLDHEKMKGLAIRNELGLLFLMTEIYYSPSKSVLDANLEAVIAHKVSLIPKNVIINPRYQNLNRIHSFFQVVNGKASIDAARTLREAQLMYLQAGNYPLLKAESDKQLFAEGSRLLEKYKNVNSLEQAKAQNVSADLTAARALIAKMDASSDFKKYYMGVVPFNHFIAALEIVNGNPDAAPVAIAHNEGYTFTNADGVSIPANALWQDWNYSIAYEAKWDALLAKKDKAWAKEAYAEAIKHIQKYCHARPHYVLPREYLKKLVQKSEQL